MSCFIENWRLIVSTLFHGLAGYSVYFYQTLLNPIELRIKDLANYSVIAHYGIEQSEQTVEWLWSGTSASLWVGIMIGSATIKYPAEKFGRRNSVMILKNMTLITAGILQFLSRPLNSIELLIFGRILSGISLAQTLLIPVFLAESSPTKYRGLVSSTPNLGGRLWALSGALVPLIPFFDSDETWNYLFLCPTLPALAHLLATPLIAKSVKHMYISAQNRKMSEKAIDFYHGHGANKEKLCKDMDNEAEVSPTIKVVNMKTMLAAKQFRLPFMLCFGAVLMLPVGGNFIVIQYSTGLLRSFGIPSYQAGFYSALIVHLPVFIIMSISVLFLERLGRRPIFLGGIALASVGNTILSLASPSQNISAHLPPVVSAVGLFFTVVGLTGGAVLIGPILPGELAPQASRSLTFGISRLAGTFVAVLFSVVFPPFNRLIGSYCIIPLPVFGMIAFALFYKLLPESKGKTVYEIVQQWLPQRKHGENRKYKKESNVTTTSFIEGQAVFSDNVIDELRVK